jgi:hypothetical protein
VADTGAVALVRAPTDGASPVVLAGLRTLSIAVLDLEEPCVGERIPAFGARDVLVVVEVEGTGFLGLALRAARESLEFRGARDGAADVREVVAEGVGAADRRLAAATEEDGTTEVRFVAGGAILGLVLADPTVADAAPGLVDTEDGLGAGLAGAFGCSRISMEGRARMNMP